MKYLFSLLFACLSLTVFAQSTQKEVHINISIGQFLVAASPQWDYLGSIQVQGTNGYHTDSLKKGDIFVDDLHHRYLIDSIAPTVNPDALAIICVCLESTCVTPQAGAGFAFRPTSNDLELIPENGSPFITEGLESKALNHNFLTIDQKLNEAFDGNGIISALPLGTVNIDANGNSFSITNTGSFSINSSSFGQILGTGALNVGVVGSGSLALITNGFTSAPNGAILQKLNGLESEHSPYPMPLSAPPSDGNSYFPSLTDSSPTWEEYKEYYTLNVIFTAGVNALPNVALPVTLSTANYHVQCTINSHSIASPSTDQMTAWVNNRTTTGFDLFVGASPGSGETLSISCTVFKPNN